MILDFRFAICDLAALGPSLSLTSLSVTPRFSFSGVGNPAANRNRFSGFRGGAQTAEAAQATHHRRTALLKLGVNEIGQFSSWIPHEVPVH